MTGKLWKKLVTYDGVDNDNGDDSDDGDNDGNASDGANDDGYDTIIMLILMTMIIVVLVMVRIMMTWIVMMITMWYDNYDNCDGNYFLIFSVPYEKVPIMGTDAHINRRVGEQKSLVPCHDKPASSRKLDSRSRGKKNRR